uniref:EF-hand domain-containing protein n=1 Tax=viral metagenome TaxID=1070528 RepID=A0A6M3L279_9ZZZZ
MRLSPCPGRIGLRSDYQIDVLEALYLGQLFDYATYDKGLDNISKLLGRPPTEMDMALWDADGDGVLTPNDARLLVEFIGLKIDDFPACSLGLQPVPIPPRPTRPPEKRQTSIMPVVAIVAALILVVAIADTA